MTPIPISGLNPSLGTAVDMRVALRLESGSIALSLLRLALGTLSAVPGRLLTVGLARHLLGAADRVLHAPLGFSITQFVVGLFHG
jgi:hypothetical protein